MDSEFTAVMGSRRGTRRPLPIPSRDPVAELYRWLLDAHNGGDGMPEDDVIAHRAELLGLDASVEVLSQGANGSQYVIDVHRPDGGRRALIMYASLLPDDGQPMLYRP
jgi:hypothetical protein